MTNHAQNNISGIDTEPPKISVGEAPIGQHLESGDHGNGGSHRAGHIVAHHNFEGRAVAVAGERLRGDFEKLSLSF